MRREPVGAPARRAGDDGLSLVEIMVTLSIMSVALVVFTGGILQVYRTVAATETLSIAQSQLQVVFQRLDKEIRYASWIAAPGSVGTSWYVEFAGAPDPATGIPPCAQLRLDGQGVLQMLRWSSGSPPAAAQRGQTLASNLVANGVDPINAANGTKPFILEPAGKAPYPSAGPSGVGADFVPSFYRLRLRLATRAGNRITTSDVAFTAVNTSYQTSLTSPCSEGRPVP